jgi:hypothetical protein
LLYFFRIVKEQPITTGFKETRSKRQGEKRVPLASGFCAAVTPTRRPIPQLDGGAGRDRTDDPLLAKQVLSQLSYSPSCDVSGGSGWIRTIDPRLIKTVL